MKPTGGTIRALQALRALAAILVVLAHAIDVSSQFGSSFIASTQRFENIGAIGVDIFFVISGVIITIIGSRQQLSAGHFLWRRCIRILPMYWGITLLHCLLTGYRWQPPHSRVELLKTITIVPVADDAYFITPLLAVGWTLAFEFLFYLVYAAGMLISRRNPAAPAITILVGCVVAGLCFPAIRDARFIFISNPIIIEFLLGCLAGHIYLLSGGKPVVTGILALVIAAIILFANFWFGYGAIDSAIETASGNLSWQRVAYWGSASFFLVAGCLLLNGRYGKLLPGWLILLGESSYATYLIHLLCIRAVVNLFKGAGFSNPDGFIVVSIIFTLLTACLLHAVVERPLQRYLSKKLAPVRWYSGQNKPVSENA